MSLHGDARQAGVAAFGALRTTLAERLAALLRRQPDLVGPAIEVGLVEKDFLDNPAGHPLRTATAAEVIQRFLERTAERRPSVLASLGLSALDALSQLTDRDADEPTGTPLAVMFTDLEGFTRFTERCGDEEASGLLAEHHRAVGPIVRSRGGRVVKRLGDGLLVTFPVPDAAVHAAVELLDAAPEPLRLRAGLNWGDVVITRDDVIGHVVNVAARVTESAKGGEVLVTEAVVDEVRDLPGLQFSRLRRRGFKGVDEPVRVCR
ncbi:MAG: adenylate/guanylate cyclase domain-containing protein, partial [Acidimicrobiales bacterium]